MIDEILVPKVNKIPRSALPIERIRMPAKIFAGRIELAIDYGRDEGTSPYTEKRSDAIESEGKRFFLSKREKWNGERNGESKRGVQQTVGNERICESANFPSEANRRIFFHHRIYNVHRRCIVANRHVICAVNLKLINPCH